jgi:hypothetical protein
MNEADLFIAWLAQQLDPDNAAQVEVEDHGEVLGTFVVDQVEQAPSGFEGSGEITIQFNDGSKVGLRMWRIE